MKLIKTLAQVVAIYSPILYWNLTVDTTSDNMGIGLILAGACVAFLIEWAYKMYVYIKS